MPLSDKEIEALRLSPDMHAPIAVPSAYAAAGALRPAIRQIATETIAEPGEWAIDADGDLRNKAGRTIAEQIEIDRKERPHLFLPTTNADDQLEAWGDKDENVLQGSMKARAKRRAELGHSAYLDEMRAWSCTETSLKPGKRPSHMPTGEKKDATTNPFSPSYTKADKLDRINALIKSKGTAFARSLAKSANADLAGRPLRS